MALYLCFMPPGGLRRSDIGAGKILSGKMILDFIEGPNLNIWGPKGARL